MGIDKSNVRYVVHRDMPKSVEGYYQEIGGAGRDGVASDCVLFYSWADLINLERMLSGEPTEARQRDQARVMYEWAERKACRHRSVVAYFGERIDDCGVSCDVCTGEDILAGHQICTSTSWRGRITRCQRDTPLFEALRALRRRLADERGCRPTSCSATPPCWRWHRLIPRPRANSLRCPVWGPVKLERYGKAFLEVLRAGE